MPTLSVAFLGDICGSAGRKVVQQQIPALVEEHQPDLIVANAENSRAGSGLTPEQYRQLRGFGIDAVTLGDHAYRDGRIIAVLEEAGEPIARPANLPKGAPGRRYIRLAHEAAAPRGVYIITVLGRLFLNMPVNDPLESVDRLLDELPETDPLVIVEGHMEATSEKAALAHHLDGRVAWVVGTHTHVQTADARVLPKGTGFITDLGMCGPYDSIIGRQKDAVLRHLTTGMFTRYGVATGDEIMCGSVARIDAVTGRAMSVAGFQYPGDPGSAPFK